MDLGQQLALTAPWFTWNHPAIASARHRTRLEFLTSQAEAIVFPRNLAAKAGPTSWAGVKAALDVLGDKGHVREVLAGRRVGAEGFFVGLACLLGCEWRELAPPLRRLIAHMAWRLVTREKPYSKPSPFSEAEADHFAHFLLMNLAQRWQHRDEPSHWHATQRDLHDAAATPIADRAAVLKVACVLGPVLIPLAEQRC